MLDCSRPLGLVVLGFTGWSRSGERSASALRLSGGLPLPAQWCGATSSGSVVALRFDADSARRRRTGLRGFLRCRLRVGGFNDGNFTGLDVEKDLLTGDNDGSGVFTIPQHPVRRRLHGVERFLTTRGGEYLFLPSLSALRRPADPGS